MSTTLYSARELRPSSVPLFDSPLFDRLLFDRPLSHPPVDTAGAAPTPAAPASSASAAMEERYRAWRESGRAEVPAVIPDRPQRALPASVRSDADAAPARRQDLAVAAEVYRSMLADRLALAMAAPEASEEASDIARGPECDDDDEDDPDPQAAGASEPAANDGAGEDADDLGSGPAPDRPAPWRFLLGRASGVLTTLMLLALAGTPLVLPQGPAARAAPLDTRDGTAIRIAPHAARTSEPPTTAAEAEPVLMAPPAVVRQSEMSDPASHRMHEPGGHAAVVAARDDQAQPVTPMHGIAGPPPRLVREPAPAVRPNLMRSRPTPLRQAQVAAPVEDGYVKDEGRPLLFDPRTQDSPGIDDWPGADVDQPPVPELAPSLRHAPDAAHSEPPTRPSRGILGASGRADAAKNAGLARKRVPGRSGRTRKAARSIPVRTSASGGLCPMTAGAYGAQTLGWPCAAASIDIAAALCTLFEGWPAPCEVRRPAVRHRAAARRGGHGYVSVNDIIMTALNGP